MIEEAERGGYIVPTSLSRPSRWSSSWPIFVTGACSSLDRICFLFVLVFLLLSVISKNHTRALASQTGAR